MEYLKFLKKLIIAAGFLFAAVFYLKSEESRQTGEQISLLAEQEETRGEDAAFGGQREDSAVEQRGHQKNSGGTMPVASENGAWDMKAFAEELAVLLPGCSCGGKAQEKVPPPVHSAAAPAEASAAAPSVAAPAAAPTEHSAAVPVQTGQTAAASPASVSGLINLNTASKEELMTLPGIGEAKADAIIRYRTEYGAFAHIEEVMNISGIKEAAFEKIKDLIAV